MLTPDKPNYLRREAWGAYATNNYDRAIEKFLAAKDFFRQLNMTRDEFQCLKGAMLVSSVLGNNDAAMSYAKSALNIIKDKSIPEEEREKFLHNYGVTLCKSGLFNDADKIFLSLIKTKDREKKIKALQGAGNAKINLGKEREALGYLNKALELNNDKRNRERMLYIKEQAASAHHKLGEYPEALKLLRYVVRERKKDKRERDWSFFHLGATLYALGRKRDALKAFEESALHIDSLLSLTRRSEYRQSFFFQKIIIIERCIQTSVELKEYQKAYYYARLAKGKIFREELLKSRRSSQDIPEIKREEELRKIMSGLSEKPGSGEEFIRLEEEHKKILKKLSEKEKLYPVFRDPPNTQEVKNILKEGEILLDYYILQDKTLLFIVSNSSFKLLEINGGIGELKDFSENINRFINGNPNEEEFLWYSSLFSGKYLPPLKEIKKAKRLLISPHGPLHHIPFSTLNIKDGERLMDILPVSLIPSPLFLKLSRKKKKKHKEIFLGIADPSLDLSSAREEVKTASGNFTDKTILNGSRARTKKVKELMPEATRIHIAAHGVFEDEDPLESYLKLYDGKLTASDILSLDLFNAKSAVLSCCSSGIGAIHQGDDCEGLSRAFILAGAGSVVSSLWEVPDAPTRRLMESYYSVLKKGKNSSEALREAMIITRSIYPKTRDWGGFVITGS